MAHHGGHPLVGGASLSVGVVYLVVHVCIREGLEHVAE